MTRDELGRWLFAVGLIVSVITGSVLAVMYWVAHKPTYTLIWAITGVSLVGLGWFVMDASPPADDDRGFEVKPITDSKSVPETKENDHG